MHRHSHRMQIRVLFFGVLKDLAGHGSQLVDLPESATLSDLLVRLQQELPRLNPHLSSSAMSINQEYARRESKLKQGDEVGLLPPVSGGTDMAAHAASRARIVNDKIDTLTLIEKIRQPEDGAVALFEGIVRNHGRGRRTLFLDYDAYPEMAVKQMDALANEALCKFAVRDVAIVHRIGRLEIGETSVAIAVASAHRGPAFDACRWLIDTLKRTVPIWKKEYFEDGAVWADGEPFPAEIPRAGGSNPSIPASK
jgi:MoaE-MoaD fusion protein